MKPASTEDMWSQFVPLWSDLRTVSPVMLLAGGFGLLLKQEWLISHLRYLATEDGNVLTTEDDRPLITEESVQTVVPMDRWTRQPLRSTKDFDFLVNLDLIASTKDQHSIDDVLKKHGFGLVKGNERWEFEKILHEDQGVRLDWIAASPTEPRDDIRISDHRVKPGKSLKGIGIHAHENREAVGAELHPFEFTHRDVTLRIPNAAVFTVMKLAAMRDSRTRALRNQRANEGAPINDDLAKKHGEDVYRALAMMTRPESEHVPAVLAAVRNGPAYADVSNIVAEYFGSELAWGSQNVGRSWQPEDRLTMDSLLADWFQ